MNIVLNSLSLKKSGLLSIIQNRKSIIWNMYNAHAYQTGIASLSLKYLSTKRVNKNVISFFSVYENITNYAFTGKTSNLPLR